MINLDNGLDLSVKVKEHVVFGDFNSLDRNMYLIDRSAPTPSEKEAIESIPFMQGTFDFSMIMGERVFANRSVSYTFHLYEEDYDTRKFSQTAFENELMRKGRVKLTDTYSPGYYFLGKCTSVDTQDDHEYNRLIVSVEFDCYPFKISTLAEGHDLWDEINFELDWLQPVEFTAKRTTFKPVSVGQTVTIGAWAIAYMGGKPVPKYALGERFKIKEARASTWGVSKLEYLFVGQTEWLSEQDVVEAQNGVTTINLYNSGTASIVPVITSDYPVSILFNGNTFNVFKGISTSQQFRLEHGDNVMQITANKLTTIEFELHKELI